MNKIPKTETDKCPRCKGKREYEISGDCHRSAGIVPCDCARLRQEMKADPRVKSYMESNPYGG